MATTLTTAQSAVFGILNGDATFKSYLTGVSGLVIFADIAPQGAVPLYAIIGTQSPGVDTLGAAGFRMLSNPLIKLVICGPQSQKTNIEAAYARADALLQPGGIPTRNTAGTKALYREAPFTLTEPELVNFETWIQFGGLYRVIL